MVNEAIRKRFLFISLGGKDTEYTAFREYFQQDGFDVSFVYDERDFYGLLENKKKS